MKTRTGFVSNSSSSSFVLREKSTGEIVYQGRADYGAFDPSEGQSLDIIILGIIEGLGLDPTDFEIEDEYQ